LIYSINHIDIEVENIGIWVTLDRDLLETYPPSHLHNTHVNMSILERAPFAITYLVIMGCCGVGEYFARANQTPCTTTRTQDSTPAVDPKLEGDL
jgi:hypothetical protein